MLFSTFSQTLSQIESTSKRLEMTMLLSGLFKELHEEEIQLVAYLLQGKLVPKYESKEFQISDKMMIRVIARLSSDEKSSTSEAQQSLLGEVDFSDKEAEITKLYKKLGDIGTVAEEVLTSSKHGKGDTEIDEVFKALQEIADASGQGSQAKKVQLTLSLLEKLDPLSAKYVSRMIIGKLRLGFSDMTMIDALSWMVKGDKSLSSQIEDAYQKRADIGYIAKVVKQKGVEALSSVKVAAGTPIIPALCQRLNSAEEIIEKMTEVYAEPKYDGTRVQLHYDKKHNILRTFTRNLEESSAMFPELKEAVNVLNCDSCILDAEAIGYDPKTGALLPFQQTIQRKRKHGVEEAVKSIPLRFFIFDILEKDGETLISKPLSERKEILKKLFKDSEIMVHAPMIQTADSVELHAYHEDQLNKGLEGVVIKMVDGVYQSGRKGYSWVKIKESEGQRGKLSDTVDGIVMGYYVGRGAKTQFGVGAVLVGVLNDAGEVLTISKVGSGFSEELAKEFIKTVKDLITKEMPAGYNVVKMLIPDFWINPSIVVEIAADEITKSPNHSSGLALRFPRILKIRTDKNWEQATKLDEISDMIVS